MPTPKADLSRLNMTQLEILTGRDRRWLNQRFAQVGLAPIETAKREKWYAARPALEAVYQFGDGEELDLSAERARLAKEQADAQALKNAELRGELIRVDALEAWLVRLIGAVVQRIRAIAPKAAPEVRATASDAEGESLLARFHDEALSELATALRGAADAVRRLRTRAVETVAGDGVDGGRGNAAAPADGERVGRRRKDAEPGKLGGAGPVEDGEG